MISFSSLNQHDQYELVVREVKPLLNKLDSAATIAACVIGIISLVLLYIVTSLIATAIASLGIVIVGMLALALWKGIVNIFVGYTIVRQRLSKSDKTVV